VPPEALAAVPPEALAAVPPEALAAVSPEALAAVLPEALSGWAQARHALLPTGSTSSAGRNCGLARRRGCEVSGTTPRVAEEPF
jgi:hypothetical protein